MKPSFILGLIVGYVLGTRAGRERYEDIVATARRVAGSQTVQATAGVMQAQVHEITARAKDRLHGKPAGRRSQIDLPGLTAMPGDPRDALAAAVPGCHRSVIAWRGPPDDDLEDPDGTAAATLTAADVSDTYSIV